jgi:diguanylate cyclase (GGDEF)-like protein
MKNFNKLSLNSYGVNYRLKIAFLLVFVLPLLVATYLASTYVVLPDLGLRPDILLLLLLSVFIAGIGFFLVRVAIHRFILLATEAKIIANGDFNHKVVTAVSDEVGDLGEVLNRLSQRIRGNMEELKSYSAKTTELNFEIQKRVLVLSSVLHISSLISEGSNLDELLQVAIEKARLLASSDAAFLLFGEARAGSLVMKVADGVECGYLMKVRIDSHEAIFHKIITSGRPFILDKQNAVSDDLRVAFYEKFRLKNAVVLPVYLRGAIAGIVGIGNTRDPFLYTKDDVELLDVFAKLIAIAVENNSLLHQVESLEVKDALTGLFNKSFIHNRLQEEIKRAIAYQRPCSFIILDIDNFKAFRQRLGSLRAEEVLKKIASLLRNSVSEVDRVARTGDNEFSIILPEKNKRQSQKIAEDIRARVEMVFGREPDASKNLTISAGVSENPLDGVEAEELISNAQELLALAKSRGKNRVESFH